MKYVTGIGSRETPESIIPIIKQLAHRLVNHGFILRSGGANGADSYFETQWDNYGGQKEIYLPWANFNNNKSGLYGVSEKALKIAQTLHPKWSSLKEPVRLLHGRNVYQVLGKELDTPSDLLIGWTPDGQIVGGTATAINLAKRMDVPVFNLALEKEVIELDGYLNLVYND